MAEIKFYIGQVGGMATVQTVPLPETCPQIPYRTTAENLPNALSEAGSRLRDRWWSVVYTDEGRIRRKGWDDVREDLEQNPLEHSEPAC